MRGCEGGVAVVVVVEMGNGGVDGAGSGGSPEPSTSPVSVCVGTVLGPLSRVKRETHDTPTLPPHTLTHIFSGFTHGVLHSIRFQWLLVQALLPDSTGGTLSPHYWVFWRGSLRCGPPLGCSLYPCLPCSPVTYSTWHVHQSLLLLGLPSISPQEHPLLSPNHSQMRAPFPAPRWSPREGTVRCP